MSRITNLNEFAKPAFNTYMISIGAGASKTKSITIGESIEKYYSIHPHLKHSFREGKKRLTKYDQIFGGVVAKRTVACYTQAKHYGCAKGYFMENKTSCTDVKCELNVINASGNQRVCNGRGENGVIWTKDINTGKFYLNNDPLLIRKNLIKQPIPLNPYLSRLYNITEDRISDEIIIKFMTDFNLTYTHMSLFFSHWENSTLDTTIDDVNQPLLDDEIASEKEDLKADLKEDVVYMCGRTDDDDGLTHIIEGSISSITSDEIIGLGLLEPFEKRLYQVIPFHASRMLREFHHKYLLANEKTKEMIHNTPEFTKTISIKVDCDLWETFSSLCNRDIGPNRVSRVINVLTKYLIENPWMLSEDRPCEFNQTITLSVDHLIWKDLKKLLINNFGKYKIQSNIINFLIDIFINTNLFGLNWPKNEV